MEFDWRDSFPKIDREATRRGFLVGIDLRVGSLRASDKRFILFVKGKYPGSHKSGYALRSRVVWWLYTGEALRGTRSNIHHKNHNRGDDRFKNLERMGHKRHSREHNPKTVLMISRKCQRCGGEFKIKEWRLNNPSRGKYCSLYCGRLAPKGRLDRITKVCVICDKKFGVIRSRETTAKFCSQSCAGKMNARNRWHGS